MVLLFDQRYSFTGQCFKIVFTVLLLFWCCSAAVALRVWRCSSASRLLLLCGSDATCVIMTCAGLMRFWCHWWCDPGAALVLLWSCCGAVAARLCYAGAILVLLCGGSGAILVLSQRYCDASGCCSHDALAEFWCYCCANPALIQ